jgi:uncharacterized damage-inducible protein DinB
MNANSSRRNFLRNTAFLALGSTVLGALNNFATAEESSADELFRIGPMKGYTPQIGTLVSMLNYNRSTVIDIVKKMTMAELDHLHDEHANTIGALIMHLGATDKLYQVNTFEGREDFNEEEKKIWGPAMELGQLGRDNIKGHEVGYYLDKISEVRATTLARLKTKDDKWLLKVDPKWSKPGKPLNTYWKWFHVCEHESNHRGQIAFLRTRLPGATPAKD